MADELETYKAQLDQVEAALTTDPENEDLLKLKHDLDEVINLTLELVQPSSTSFTTAFPSSPSAEGGDAASTASTAAASSSNSAAATGAKAGGAQQSVFAGVKQKHSRNWKPGDRCMAPWNDGRFHPAKIDEILEDGVCSVAFEGYGQTEVGALSKLLPYIAEEQPSETGPGSKRAMSKKDLMEREKDRKKKKKARWVEKVKEIEESREKEKNKWQNFNSKAITKSKKGTIKKSIFATPEDGNMRGRVGFGTCGMGGKDMTKNEKVAHWKPSLQDGTGKHLK